MDAKKWLRRNSIRGIKGTVPFEEDWQMSLEHLCNYMTRFALHSADERYEKAINHAGIYYDLGVLPEVKEALKIASGKIK